MKFFFDLLSLPETARIIESVFFTWIPAGQFHVNVAFLLDPLSAVMVLVVSGVSFIIHGRIRRQLYHPHIFYRLYA